jgi:hypothetical protein
MAVDTSGDRNTPSNWSAGSVPRQADDCLGHNSGSCPTIQGGSLTREGCNYLFRRPTLRTPGEQTITVTDIANGAIVGTAKVNVTP